MLLERDYVDIQSVIFDDQSFIDGHILHICKASCEETARDTAFSDINISILAPCSGSRILNVGDVVQPTLRLSDPEATFPGLIGKLRTAGSGKSLMLRNIAVSEVVEIQVDIASMLELSEAGQSATDLAALWHVTVDAFPAEGIARYDYLQALHLASKRVAKYIAQIAKDCPPDETETFTLEREGLEGLPRIAYLANVFCHRPYTESTVYGASMLESLPTILHPNEILDGALTFRNYDNSANADPTYGWQNHQIILELYRRHGVDLNFVGVVVNNVHHALEYKERNAVMSAALLHHQLHAECCIITKEGGGHPHIDVGLAADALEGLYGIKTTVVIMGLGDAKGQVLFQSPYTNAIVSSGGFKMMELPAANQVIGTVWRSMYSPNAGFHDPMKISLHSMPCGGSQLGWTRFGSLTY
jgi:glycine reductase